MYVFVRPPCPPRRESGRCRAEAIKLPFWQDGWGRLGEVLHQRPPSNYSKLVVNGFCVKVVHRPRDQELKHRGRMITGSTVMRWDVSVDVMKAHRQNSIVGVEVLALPESFCVFVLRVQLYTMILFLDLIILFQEVLSCECTDNFVFVLSTFFFRLSIYLCIISPFYAVNVLPSY